MKNAPDTIDLTPRLNSLKAANKVPVSVQPNDKLRKAVTLMLRHDFSQLPVMQSSRSVKGIISWKSIGEQSQVQNRECSFVRDCMETTFVVLKQDDLLWEGISAIADNDFVLVENRSREICGLVTTSDIAAQYHFLAEPFLLLGEIENNLRQLITRAGYSPSVLRDAKDPRDTKRQVHSVSDLSFGEYLRILQDPENFRAIGLGLSRTTLIEQLTTIKNIRNEVMHFRPGGLDFDDLLDLRLVAKMLRKLNLRSKPEPMIKSEKAAPSKSIRPSDKETTLNSQKLKIAEMIALGRVNVGDTLTIAGKAGSNAEVIDSKNVRLEDGQIMTWNEYGQKFTGHVAVNVYRHVIVNGVLLETLRRR